MEDGMDTEMDLEFDVDDAGADVQPSEELTQVLGNYERELHNATLRMLAEAKAGRPVSTRTTYDGKHKRWLVWCAEKNCPDGAIVHAKKFVYYLTDEIIAKGNYTAYKKNIKDGLKEFDIVPITRNTVEGQVSAVIDLWKEQVALNQNSYALSLLFYCRD